jgi:AhpC/TSA family
MSRRWNIAIWAGFAVVLVALLSYIPFFALFPVTRDVPWANFLLFAAGGCLLAMGLKRAFKEPKLYRGKISGSIFGVLSLLMAGFFCYGIFYYSKQVPSAAAALHAGQPAPDFTLTSADGRPVVLSDLVRDHRAVVLIFYRGHW